MRRCWAASSSHVVQLWNAAQALVATSVASTETSGYSGWVEVDFPTPIAVTAEEDWTGSVEFGGHAYSFAVDLADAARVSFVDGPLHRRRGLPDQYQLGRLLRGSAL